jgi:hypothetical protein
MRKKYYHISRSLWKQCVAFSWLWYLPPAQCLRLFEQQLMLFRSPPPPLNQLYVDLTSTVHHGQNSTSSIVEWGRNGKYMCVHSVGSAEFIKAQDGNRLSYKACFWGGIEFPYSKKTSGCVHMLPHDRALCSQSSGGWKEILESSCSAHSLELPNPYHLVSRPLTSHKWPS